MKPPRTADMLEVKKRLDIVWLTLWSTIEAQRTAPPTKKKPVKQIITMILENSFIPQWEPNASSPSSGHPSVP